MSIISQIKAETLILQGDPKDKICQAAEELHVDLVVIGSRGLGTIKRYTYTYRDEIWRWEKKNKQKKQYFTISTLYILRSTVHVQGIAR